MNPTEWRAVIGLGAVYALRMVGPKFTQHAPAVGTEAEQ